MDIYQSYPKRTQIQIKDIIKGHRYTSKQHQKDTDTHQIHHKKTWIPTKASIKEQEHPIKATLGRHGHRPQHILEGIRLESRANLTEITREHCVVKQTPFNNDMWIILTFMLSHVLCPQHTEHTPFKFTSCVKSHQIEYKIYNYIIHILDVYVSLGRREGVLAWMVCIRTMVVGFNITPNRP